VGFVTSEMPNCVQNFMVRTGASHKTLSLQNGYQDLIHKRRAQTRHATRAIRTAGIQYSANGDTIKYTISTRHVAINPTVISDINACLTISDITACFTISDINACFKIRDINARFTISDIKACFSISDITECFKISDINACFRIGDNNA
jgi:hypothetical protein